MPESYTVVAMTTGHLTQQDSILLEHEAIHHSDGMILIRDPGLFIKLYDEEVSMNFQPWYSESLRNIIEWAWHQDYRMIEFDCDAGRIDEFEIFDW